MSDTLPKLDGMLCFAIHSTAHAVQRAASRDRRLTLGAQPPQRLVDVHDGHQMPLPNRLATRATTRADSNR